MITTKTTLTQMTTIIKPEPTTAAASTTEATRLKITTRTTAEIMTATTLAIQTAPTTRHQK
jgi:hypothetical protein